MWFRKILLGCLIFATLIVPLIQLSIGFYYINSPQLCPLQQDIMLLMSIGGVFEAIFFVAALGFVMTIIPARYKTDKKLTAAQLSAKGSNLGLQLLIGAIMCIFCACATLFFILIHVRVYGNFKKAQWTYPNQSNYCLFAIFSSAFGLMIADYVAIILLFITAIILLFGIGM